MERRYILASKSPRRVELLTNLGLEFDTIPSDINENIEREGTFGDFVEKLAYLKGSDIAKKVKNRVIISSDTIVVLGDRILTKPKSSKEAFDTLKLLSGKKHQVYTSVSIIDQENSIVSVDHVKTDVFFEEMSNNDIEWYISTSEPFDKAGSYGIQGKGSRFIKRIDGCFFAVMGFPVSKFVKMMSKIGIKI